MRNKLIAAIAVCLAAALCIAAVINLNAQTGSEYDKTIKKYAAENGIDPMFVYAVIRTESAFDPDAVSDADAIGLMQMTEVTFDWVKWRTGGDEEFSDLFDPEISIEYGTYFLGYLYEEFGDYSTVAAAYHAGLSQVKEWLQYGSYSSDGRTLDNIPASKTAHYVKKVMNNYEDYLRSK